VIDRDPAHLHPIASAKMAQLLSLTQHAGLPVVLQETYRDYETQAADYAKGRDEHGNIVDAKAVVTQAKPGYSWHNLRRWIRQCSDCGHEPAEHGPSSDALPAFKSCTACGRRCLAVNVTAWKDVPASMAWHFYIPTADGGLEGFGAHPLTAESRARYLDLGRLGQSIEDVVWGGDFDRDGTPFEPGEWDLGHFHVRPKGATLLQVKAVLAIRGGELVYDRGSLRT
jgi:hypothetical protein